MAWFSDTSSASSFKGPLLVIEDLHVYYGQAHALQGISLSLSQGVLGVVGRNGEDREVARGGAGEVHREERRGSAGREKCTV